MTNAASSVIARYTWGLDLSGSLQGAGGIRLRSGSYGGQVGGLLAVDKLSGTGTSAFCGFDGNGNLGQLVDTSDGTLLARYEYAPYGREMRATGTLADWNRIRFSTKYLDPETDLYCYGYRWYSPGLGRWASRDPMGEHAGQLLYAIVNNDLANRHDPVGLAPGFGDICDWIGDLVGIFILPPWCPDVTNPPSLGGAYNPTVCTALLGSEVVLDDEECPIRKDCTWLCWGGRYDDEIAYSFEEVTSVPSTSPCGPPPHPWLPTTGTEPPGVPGPTPVPLPYSPMPGAPARQFYEIKADFLALET